MGQPLSRESVSNRDADAVLGAAGNTPAWSATLAGAEPPLCGNREVSRVTASDVTPDFYPAANWSLVAVLRSWAGVAAVRGAVH
jgi:hypothetical protein